MAAECGMGLPNIEARDEPVPIIRLLVSGKGIAWSQNGGLLPSLFPVLQCSLCSVLCDKTPPQRGDGGGFLKEQPAIPTPLYSFFFFFNNQPLPTWIPPSFHGDYGAGRGAACYSEHGLSEFQICYCSFPRVERGRLSL